MTRERHVRFCERPWVQLPGPTQPTNWRTEYRAPCWPRRYALMPLHTALHVMSCVVVAPVTGGNIALDKARLDFDFDMSLRLVTSICNLPPSALGLLGQLDEPTRSPNAN
jgi:hypothetical protein